MGKPKGVFFPAECQGHRKQTEVSCKIITGGRCLHPKGHKATPVKGREVRLVEELDKRHRIRATKFLVERGTKDESSKESDDLPDYEESDATVKPKHPAQRRSASSSGSDCD